MKYQQMNLILKNGCNDDEWCAGWIQLIEWNILRSEWSVIIVDNYDICS